MQSGFINYLLRKGGLNQRKDVILKYCTVQAWVPATALGSCGARAEPAPWSESCTVPSIPLGGNPAWAQGKPVPRPDAAGLGCWMGTGVKERCLALWNERFSKCRGREKQRWRTGFSLQAVEASGPLWVLLFPRRGLLIFKTILMEIY